MGWFSSLFSKKETNPSSKPLVLSWFGTDIHSHLLPGVDDGAQTMDESIAMVSKMAALGFRQCVLTSHVKMDIYPNESHRLKNAFEQLKNEVEALSLPIHLALAAEYYIDDSLLTRLAENDILSFGKERYVLMEFSFATPPVQEQKVFDAFLTAGYKPILAHFERYGYFHGSVEKALAYRKQGVFIQMNLNSLTGHYGVEVRKQAERLIDEFALDFVGTDAHRMDHLTHLEANLSLPYFRELGNRLMRNQGL